VSNYEYQLHSANEIIKNMTVPGTEAAILAAAPGSGKTTISHIVIQKYIQKYPNAKILVLAHGQNLLKNQYLRNLENPHIKIDFKFGDFSSDKTTQVFVGIPQSIDGFCLEKIDLLVVDECHEFYLKKMVQNIVKKYSPKHQLLLTGSPSEFNRLKSRGKNYKITYICADDLMNKNVFSDVEMDVVKLFNNRNMNIVGNIKKMIEHAEKKGKNLSKLMVAVTNTKQAGLVKDFLQHIGRKVALSTSKNDPDGVEIEKFQKNQYDTLVVVQRGILGFSDNNITGLFDLRCSKDVEVSNQMFSRVLRKHPDNIEKFYYRCGNKMTKDWSNQVTMLYQIKSLMKKDMFKMYDGSKIDPLYLMEISCQQ
jgi:superfamily II DNA or RNA helicase